MELNLKRLQVTKSVHVSFLANCARSNRISFACFRYELFEIEPVLEIFKIPGIQPAPRSNETVTESLDADFVAERRADRNSRATRGDRYDRRQSTNS